MVVELFFARFSIFLTVCKSCDVSVLQIDVSLNYGTFRNAIGQGINLRMSSEEDIAILSVIENKSIFELRRS